MKIEDNTNQDSQPSMKKKSNEISSLPDELVLEILQWLPVLPLLKCRSVCKLWVSLISSPSFVKTHLLKSTETTQFSDLRLISASSRPPFNKIKECSMYSLLNEPYSKAVDSPIKGRRVVGSFNGLVCLVSFNNQLLIWNPATRKSKKLQISEISSREFVLCKTVYGFGYDEHNDDYKVVGIFYCNANYASENDTYKMKVKIYSSRLDCWRNIEDFPSYILLSQWYESGNFANEALHWAASRDKSESPESWIIVSLDLKTEIYGEIVQPNYGEGTYDLVLGVVERSLCVVCNYQNIRADVWLMKEYGVKESWTKLVSIPYFDYETMLLGYSVPICISQSGELWLKIMNDIVVYNFKDNRFKDLVITNFHGCYRPETYIESLVSPNV